MTTRRWQLHRQSDALVAAEVAAVLAADGVIALPTETFYGLAASCRSSIGLARVCRLKRRPADMPLLLLVDGTARAAELVDELTPLAAALMQRFWPGPLTVAMPAAAGLPGELLGPQGTVALRHSAHPFPCAVVAALGAAITGTSANLSGCPPPRSATEVALADEQDLAGIVDGGLTAGGPPSTLVRVAGDRVKVLRAGVIGIAALREVAGSRLL